LEPENSLLSSQGPVTGSNHEPDETSPTLPILFPLRPIYSSFGVSDQNFICLSHLPHTC